MKLIQDLVSETLRKYKTGAYAILQLPVEDEKTFRGYDDIHGIVDLYKYQLVYTGSLNKIVPDKINYILEDIYEKLNIAHPADYTARSLSVSDIIVIKHDDTITYYFCDRIGFRQLKNI